MTTQEYFDLLEQGKEEEADAKLARSEELEAMSDFGKRSDGTPKGRGWLGPMDMTDGSGQVMTENTVGVNIDGKETEIPTLVPTLSKEDINYLLAGNAPSEEIVGKAVEHARGRLEKGLSPFYEDSGVRDLTPRELPPLTGASAVEQPKERPGYVTQFSNDFARSVDGLQMMAGGLLGVAGEAVGSPRLTTVGLDMLEANSEEMKKNPALIGSFQNINSADDAVRYLIEAVGENAMYMLPGVVSGGVSGLVARRVMKTMAAEAIEGLVAKGVVREKAARAVAMSLKRQAAEKLAENVASGAGAYAASAGMETGSIAGDMYEQTGRIDPGLSIKGGLAAGALDAIPNYGVIKMALGGQMAGKVAKELEKGLGRDVLETLLKEASTEVVQTIIEKATVAEKTGENIFEEDDLMEYVDAALKGGLGSVPVAAGGHMIGKLTRGSSTPELDKSFEDAAPRDSARANTAPAPSLADAAAILEGDDEDAQDAYDEKPGSMVPLGGTTGTPTPAADAAANETTNRKALPTDALPTETPGATYGREEGIYDVFADVRKKPLEGSTAPAAEQAAIETIPAAEQGSNQTITTPQDGQTVKSTGSYPVDAGSTPAPATPVAESATPVEVSNDTPATPVVPNLKPMKSSVSGNEIGYQFKEGLDDETTGAYEVPSILLEESEVTGGGIKAALKERGAKNVRVTTSKAGDARIFWGEEDGKSRLDLKRVTSEADGKTRYYGRSSEAGLLHSILQKPSAVASATTPAAPPPESTKPAPSEQETLLGDAQSRYDSEIATYKSQRRLNLIDDQELGKKLKAAGMRFSAEKRKITGQLTDKEAEAEAKREASNYIGKLVEVDGKPGKVVGNPFGRVRVKLDGDGTTITASPDKVVPRTSAPVQPIISEKPTTSELVGDQPTQPTSREIPETSPIVGAGVEKETPAPYAQEDKAYHIGRIADERERLVAERDTAALELQLKSNKARLENGQKPVSASTLDRLQRRVNKAQRKINSLQKFEMGVERERKSDVTRAFNYYGTNQAQKDKAKRKPPTREQVDNEFTRDSVVQKIIDAGGLLSKAELERRGTPPTGGEYDDVPNFSAPQRALIFNTQTGLTFDKMAPIALGNGATARDLSEYLGELVRREARRPEDAPRNYDEAMEQMEASDKSRRASQDAKIAAAPVSKIKVSALPIGERFQLIRNGEAKPFTVAENDPDFLEQAEIVDDEGNTETLGTNDEIEVRRAPVEDETPAAAEPETEPVVVSEKTTQVSDTTTETPAVTEAPAVAETPAVATTTKNEATTPEPVVEQTPAVVLTGDAAEDADYQIALHRADKHYTLWGGSSKNRSWTYLSILGQNYEEAKRKAVELGRKLMSNEKFGVAFYGKATELPPGTTVGLIDRVLTEQDLAPIAPKTGIGQQALGFGKRYPNVIVDDLPSVDMSYVEWMVGKASEPDAGRKLKDVVEHLKNTNTKVLEMIESKRGEQERIKAYEERQANKGKTIPAQNLSTENTTTDNKVEVKKVEKKTARKASDQIVDIVAPNKDVKNVVPPRLAKNMFPIQVAGANATIASLDKSGASLNGDGAGVGKTRQIVAVADHYARQGLPVIIITENAAIGKPWEGSRKVPVMGGSMAKDSQAMGVSLKLLDNGETPNAGEIRVSTYNRIEPGQIPNNAVVIFDESQNLANTFGDISKPKGEWKDKFSKVFTKAGRIAFYSATPADKPHQLAYLYKVLGFGSPQEYLDAALENGMVERKRKFGKTEIKFYDVPSKSPIKLRKLYGWVNGLIQQAGVDGRAIKREISYEGTDIQFHDTTGTNISKNPWAEKFLGVMAQLQGYAAENWFLPAFESHVLYSAELAKIGDAVDMVKRELAAGRKAVLFFSRIREHAIRGRKRVVNPDGTVGLSDPVVLGTIPSPVELLRDELNKLGISFAELHGESDDTSKTAQEKFSSNVDVLLASVESGGTGINLDDPTGKNPRTEIFMFAPYRGISTIQAMGRIWRSSTVQDDNKPNRYIFVVASDIGQDATRSAVLAKKLQLMNASLGGTAVSRLPMSKVGYSPDQLAGLELPDDGEESPLMQAEEFAPGPLLPIEIEWKQSKRGNWWSPASADLLEWMERGGPERTGTNVRVFKGTDGRWVAFSEEPYTADKFELKESEKTTDPTPIDNTVPDADPTPTKTQEEAEAAEIVSTEPARRGRPRRQRVSPEVDQEADEAATRGFYHYNTRTKNFEITEDGAAQSAKERERIEAIVKRENDKYGRQDRAERGRAIRQLQKKSTMADAVTLIGEGELPRIITSAKSTLRSAIMRNGWGIPSDEAEAVALAAVVRTLHSPTVLAEAKEATEDKSPSAIYLGYAITNAINDAKTWMLERGQASEVSLNQNDREQTEDTAEAVDVGDDEIPEDTTPTGVTPGELVSADASLEDTELAAIYENAGEVMGRVAKIATKNLDLYSTGLTREEAGIYLRWVLNPQRQGPAPIKADVGNGAEARAAAHRAILDARLQIEAEMTRDSDGEETGENIDAPENTPASFTPVIPQEMYASALKALRAELNKLGMGVDPTILKNLIVVGAYHAERGARKFGHWAERMVSDVGEEVAGVLKKVYARVKSLFRGAKTGFDKSADVRTAKVPTAVLSKEETTEVVSRAVNAGRKLRARSRTPFYSKAAQVIEAKVQGRSTSFEQIKAILTNPQNGVKTEELKWSGVLVAAEKMASENNGAVSKDALLDYLENSGKVEFEEVVLGKLQGTEVVRQASDAVPWGERRGESLWIIPGGTLFDVGSTPQEAADRWNEANRPGDSVGAIAKYRKYQLPGGEDYREVVLVLPDRATQAGVKFQGYTSPHFPSIPNYVAHMRFNKRTDLAGKRGRFIEEIQSDLHQKARKQGYQGESSEEIPLGYRLRDLNEEARQQGFNFPVDAPQRWRFSTDDYSSSVYPSREEALEALRKRASISPKGMPDAPFQKDWSLQMFKRALRDAVDSGESWIGWTSGDTQAQRYDLSKQLSKIEWIEDTKQLWGYNKDGDKVINESATREQLPGFIGKEATARLLEVNPYAEGQRILSGIDLKVGGEGMRGFYDNILPKEVAKYVKQWGGVVEKGSILAEELKQGVTSPYDIEQTPNGQYVVYDNRGAVDPVIGIFPTLEEAKAGAEKEIPLTPIWRVDITPQMRESVSEKGQALFARSRKPQDTTGELFGDETPFNLVGEVIPAAPAKPDTVVDAEAREKAARESGARDVDDLFGGLQARGSVRRRGSRTNRGRAAADKYVQMVRDRFPGVDVKVDPNNEDTLFVEADTGTLVVNPEKFADLLPDNPTPEAIDRVVTSLVAHEVAHVAALNSLTSRPELQEKFQAMQDWLFDSGKWKSILRNYLWDRPGITDEELQAYVDEHGRDVVAHEFLRMQGELAARGQTSEMALWLSRSPGNDILDLVVRYLMALADRINHWYLKTTNANLAELLEELHIQTDKLTKPISRDMIEHTAAVAEVSARADRVLLRARTRPTYERHTETFKNSIPFFSKTVREALEKLTYKGENMEELLGAAKESLLDAMRKGGEKFGVEDAFKLVMAQTPAEGMDKNMRVVTQNVAADWFEQMAKAFKSKQTSTGDYLAEYYDGKAADLRVAIAAEHYSPAGQTLAIASHVYKKLRDREFGKMYTKAAAAEQERELGDDPAAGKVEGAIDGAVDTAAAGTVDKAQGVIDGLIKKARTKLRNLGLTDAQLAELETTVKELDALKNEKAIDRDRVVQAVADKLANLIEKAALSAEDQAKLKRLPGFETILRGTVSRMVRQQFDSYFDEDAKETDTDEQKEARRQKAVNSLVSEVQNLDLARAAFEATKAELYEKLDNDGESNLNEEQLEIIDSIKFDETNLPTAVRVLKASLNMREEVRKSLTAQRTNVNRLAHEIAELSGLSPEQAVTVAKALQSEYEKAAKVEIEKAIEQLMKSNDPEIRKAIKSKSTHEKLFEAANLGALRRQAVWNALAPNYGLPSYDPAFVREIEQRAERIQTLAEDSQQRNLETRLLMTDIAYRQIAEAKGAAKKGIRYIDTFLALWKAGILSGPPTQIVNFGFSHINSLLSAAANARALSRMAKKSGNKEAKSYFGYLGQLLSGTYSQLGRAKQESANALRYGWSRFQNEKIESLGLLEGIKFDKNNPWKLEGILAPAKYVGRFMQATDALNSSMASEMAQRAAVEAYILQNKLTKDEANKLRAEVFDNSEEIRKKATEQADREMKEGQFRGQGKAAQSLYRSRIEQLVEIEREKYIPGIIQLGRSEGERIAFNQPADRLIGFVMRGLFAPLNRTLRATQILMPFPNTIANLLNTSLDYTPYGYLRANNISLSDMLTNAGKLSDEFAPKKIEKGSFEYEQAVSKAWLGTIGIAAILSMVIKGLLERDDDPDKVPWFEITGEGPADLAAQEQLKTTGWMPYTVKIGGLRLRYTDWPALNMVMGVFGTITDNIVYNKGKGIAPLPAIISVFATTLDRNMLSGLSDFFQIVNNPNQSGANKLARIAFGTVGGVTNPNLVRWLRNTFATDESGMVPRLEQRTLAGKFAALAPFSAGYDGVSMNVLGEPIRSFQAEATTNRFGSFFDKSHPTLSPLAEVGLFLKDPSYQVVFSVPKAGKIQDYKLTPEEQMEFTKVRGPILKKALNKVTVARLTALARRDYDAAKDELQKLTMDVTKQAKQVYAKRKGWAQ